MRIQEIDISFQVPEHGWLPVHLRLDDFQIDIEALDVMNDPIAEMLDLIAYCILPSREKALVYFWLEPAGYALLVSNSAMEGHLHAQIFYNDSFYSNTPNTPDLTVAPIFEGELLASYLRSALINCLELLFTYTPEAATGWTCESDWVSYRARLEELR